MDRFGEGDFSMSGRVTWAGGALCGVLPEKVVLHSDDMRGVWSRAVADVVKSPSFAFDIRFIHGARPLAMTVCTVFHNAISLKYW